MSLFIDLIDWIPHENITPPPHHLKNLSYTSLLPPWGHNQNETKVKD